MAKNYKIKLKTGKELLLGILNRYKEQIIRAAAVWVHARSVDLKGDKPGAATIKLATELFLSYQEALSSKKYYRLNKFIKDVVDYRAQMSFHMSTLVMGSLSFKKALLPILKKECPNLARQIEIISLIDAVYEHALFKETDLYQKTTTKGLEGLVRERTKELEESKSYVESVMNSIADPLFTFDRNARIIYVNPAYEEVFGWKKDEVLGNSAEEFHAKLLPLELRSKMTDIVKKRVKIGDTIRSEEVTAINKRGEKLAVLYSATGIRDTQGNFKGEVAVLINITELKKTQAALYSVEQEKRALVEKSSKELEQRVKERTEEFQEKAKEMEKFYKLSVGRELKMNELKEENKKLKS